MKKIISIILLIFFYASIIPASSRAAHTAVITTKRDFPIGMVSFGSSVRSGVLGTDNFIDGYIKKAGDDTFVFPVGDDGFLRPFAAAGSQTIGAYFGVSPSSAVTSNPLGGNFGVLPAGGPFSINSMGKEIKKVTDKEYWDIDGSSPTKITLTWDADSDVASLLAGKGLPQLTIVGWDGSKWVEVGSTFDATSVLGGSSTLTAGSITTDAPVVPDTYNVYSLAALQDAALPVTLVAFNATAVEHTVRLDWSTSSEVNSSHFDIERSSNGKAWETLGNMPTKSVAEGTVPDFNTYQYVDKKPLAGENYYRLKMVDRDDTYAYSNIRHVAFDRLGEVVVYPNPVSERIYLTGFDQKAFSQAKMVDGAGRVVYESKSFFQGGVDVSKMPAGVYVLNLVLSDGQPRSYKVLIKR